MEKDIKLTKKTLDDGLKETVTLRTLAKFMKENNREVKLLRKDIKALANTITEMLKELKVGVKQTQEGVRIADQSIKAIDKLADSVKEDVK